MTVHPPHRPSDAAILSALEHYGYPRPTAPAIIALRRPEEPGEWNDLLGVMGSGASCFIVGTTDPGLQPMRGTGRVATNAGGAARVSAGYHPAVFEAGWHHSDRSHPALTQVRTRPLPVERWDRQRGVWQSAPPAVGRFNLHRARWEGMAPVVGDYSHGCLVARDRREHWELLLAAGYPPHGPRTDADRALRWDLYLIDWSAWLTEGVR